LCKTKRAERKRGGGPDVGLRGGGKGKEPRGHQLLKKDGFTPRN